jgi:GNAT superfamily N-acetyltransferase
MHRHVTETLGSTRTLPGVTIRPYRPFDHSACRRLWGELVEHQRALLPDSPGAGRDPGAGFEEYLTRLDLSGMWVADEAEEGVVGFVGLVLDGRYGAVEPVVVTPIMRGRGIGSALLGRIADEARRRGLARLTVSPSARDVSALHTLHSTGFNQVASITLSYDLTGRGNGGARAIDFGVPGQPGTIALYDLNFRL